MVGQTSFFCFGWCGLEDLVSLGSNALPDIGAVGEERGGGTIRSRWIVAGFSKLPMMLPYEVVHWIKNFLKETKIIMI